ncbi:MAG: STAS domain-containing protein [Anaerolineae bacterium]|nr:STAS domain-containing protein [Anaerolineae bacterium]MCB0226551.1 STAS domain-containing protein [Anaerolineae bacterium]
MIVEAKQLRRCDVVVAKGRIDTSTVKTLSEALAAITGSGRYKIVLNLKEVTFISSAGLGELIATQNTCKKLLRGELVLAEVPQRVVEVLDLAGLAPLFKIFPSELEAVGSF